MLPARPSPKSNCTQLSLVYAALPAQEFFDRVINDVRQFSERKSFDDDVCVVGMEVQHTG
jgi:serine phosphatase RsbU (regulator of sigma subunit)